ncbi:PIG-L family deacetylase [Zunongwangia sp.]|uniref:PIG-L family deacetylase n=1 Tax=Zunongwangia sp. TaxID=1965325 RepID=UPI003AA9064A
MRKLLFLLILYSNLAIYAQTPKKLSATEIYEKIEKLNFLGSVLYIAAHPDDENTQLISYFSNEKHARTGYLSLTRGDGGQNLIGSEIREKLGVIRTEELLAARRIDGGMQFFSRANDFGYSKNPTEALKTWNKNDVLSDVVWVIRKFQPDVIINRFDHRTPGTTHGHHTASAMLSVEAFDLANNKSVFPEQLKYTNNWQPSHLFFNTSPWFYKSNQKAFEKAVTNGNFLAISTGNYYPLKGVSNQEIASKSRSQHQSQGFGSLGTRGKQLEYLEPIKGDSLTSKNLFEGIDTSWNRVKGGREIGTILNNVQQNFDFTNPSASLPNLLLAYKKIQNLQNKHWKTIKTQEIKTIITACAGLFLEASTTTPYASPGDSIALKIEAINRSNAKIALDKIIFEPQKKSKKITENLTNNTDWQREFIYKIPENASYTSPYWLKNEGTVGMYRVDNQELIGKPETPHATKIRFELSINGYQIPIDKEVVYKFKDRVLGETYQNFEIIPPVSVEFAEDIVLFPNKNSKTIQVTVTSKKANISGELQLNLSSEWKISPKKHLVNLSEKESSQKYSFTITPPSEQTESWITPEITINGEIYNEQVSTIAYSHIPTQTLVLPSKLKLAKINIQKKGEKIAYISGAGDVVPASLQQIGYNVTLLSPNEISAKKLANFDAVVTGIRAYNVLKELRFKNKELMKYVENGGTLISQYNKDRDIKVDQIGPYPFTLSYDRVTEENAKVTFINPEAPILNYPNKITAKDFEGWVQERGLYFPSSWSPEYETVLAMHDENEDTKTGSLLISKYGKGYYVYTGLSFFRQFPAGVAGSFRLFANLLSLGN